MTENNNSTENVIVGKFKAGGYAFSAPVTTKLPETASASLDAGFKNQGFISDKGMNWGEKVESKTFKDVNGDTVKTVIQSKEITLKFSLLEFLRVDTLKTVYGDENVKVTPKSSGANTQITISVNSKEPPARAWVFEVFDDGKPVRIVAPNAKISETGDKTFSAEELAQHELTLTCLADSKGNSAYIYAELNDKGGN